MAYTSSVDAGEEEWVLLTKPTTSEGDGQLYIESTIQEDDESTIPSAGEEHQSDDEWVQDDKSEDYKSSTHQENDAWTRDNSTSHVRNKSIQDDSDHHSDPQEQQNDPTLTKSPLQAINEKDEEELSPENGGDANLRDDSGCAFIGAQRCGLEETVTPPGQRPTPSFGTQVWPSSGRTTIKGFFPAGTKLDISTPDGSRQIIVSGQPINASNVSVGVRSFQFIGDSESLSALLRGGF